MIRNLIGFVLFMVLFIIGGQFGFIGGALGFVGGIATWIAVSTGKLDFAVRPLVDTALDD